MQEKKRVALQTRIPKDDHEKLRQLSYVNDISINALIVASIKRFLDDQKKVFYLDE